MTTPRFIERTTGVAAITRSLLRQRRQLLMSAAIVVLGVAYLAGSLSLLGRVGNGLDDLAGIGSERADFVVEGPISVDTPLEQTRQLVPDSLVQSISHLEGVRTAIPIIEDTAVVLTESGNPVVPLGLTEQPRAVNWPDDNELNPYRLLSGSAPTGDDQVALDRSTARRGGLSVGDVVLIQTKSQVQRATVSGIVERRGRDLPPGTSLVLVPTLRMRVLFDRANDDNFVAIALQPGADRSATRDRIATSLPSNVELVDGPTHEQHLRILLSKSFELIRLLLLMFAVLALVVGAFTVANSNALLFARRRNTFALFRLVGATPRQLQVAAVTEAVVVGAAAAVMGLPLGILAGTGLEWALGRLGSALPVAGGPLSWSMVAITGGVSVLVTTLTALLPARQAAATAPMVAVTRADTREVARAPRSQTLASIAICGSVGVIVGSLLSDEPSTLLLGMGVGVGIAVSAWLLPRTLTGAVAAVSTWLIGRSRALQSLTALRSRSARTRAASTAAALLIATLVVSSLATLSASFVASAEGQVEQIVRADLMVDSGTFTRGGLPADLVEQLSKISGVQAATGIRVGAATLGGQRIRLSGLDRKALFKVLDLGVTNPPSELSDTGMVVDEDTATRLRLSVGSQIDLIFDNAVQPMRVDAIARRSSPLLGGVMIDRALLARLTPASVDFVALVAVDRNDRSATVERVKETAARYGVQRVGAPTALVDRRADVLRGFERVIQWMVLFSVALALFGVVNTLHLGVRERRRELGLLRSVGATPGQVQRLVVAEATALSVVGSITGVVGGVGLARVAVGSLSSVGLTEFSLPAPILTIIGVTALAVGVLGGWIPARQAARAGIVEALGDDDLAAPRRRRRARDVPSASSRDLSDTGTESAPPSPRLDTDRSRAASVMIESEPDVETPGVSATEASPAPSESFTERYPETTMPTCVSCGSHSEGGRFCSECGSELPVDSTSMFSTAAPRPAPEPAAPAAAKSSLWSTGQGDEQLEAPPRSWTSNEPVVVDAAVIDDLDDDYDELPDESPNSVPLGSIFEGDQLRARRARRRGPRRAHQPAAATARPRQPEPPVDPIWYAPAGPPPPIVVPGPDANSSPPPPTPNTPMLYPEPVSNTGMWPTDPHGVDGALSRLCPEAQEYGEPALLVAATLLGPDERVRSIIQGWSSGAPAVAVMTAVRILVVAERRWKPTVEVFPIRASLSVYGRHLDGRASITFQDAEHVITLDQIPDVPVAVEFANLARNAHAVQEF